MVKNNIGSYVLLALLWINDSYQQISNCVPVYENVP